MLSNASVVMSFKVRASFLLTVLAFANVLAWCAALRLASTYPVLLSSALLAYGLGLRHAFDVDHIAAIDNVTRRLVAEGGRPAGVGFFFSLGHSSVVMAATAGIAFAAGGMKAKLWALQALLGPFSTVASSVFLLTIGALNALIFLAIWRAIRQPRAAHGQSLAAGHRSKVAPISVRLARMLGWVTRSWLMYPLGVVFGLGFDTATEIGVLGIAAGEAVNGLSFWSILIFPALFTAGMSLADTLEALLALGAYRWTSSRPTSRLYYNLAATGASILAGLTVAAAQLIGLAPRASGWLRPFGAAAKALSAHPDWFGFLVVATFAALWGGWALFDRARATVPVPQ